MKDFLNREITVGDIVIYQTTSGQAGYLTLAKVTGFTPKMVKIDMIGRGWGNKAYPDKLAIIPNNEMLRLLKPDVIKKIIAAGKMDELINLQKDGDMKDYPVEWILATLDLG